jgi:hypothetical protein
LWGKLQDRYILNLLNIGLNKIPPCPKPIDKLTEKECDVWIKQSLSMAAAGEHSTTTSYQIEVPRVEKEYPLQKS